MQHVVSHIKGSFRALEYAYSMRMPIFFIFFPSTLRSVALRAFGWHEIDSPSFTHFQMIFIQHERNTHMLLTVARLFLTTASIRNFVFHESDRLDFAFRLCPLPSRRSAGFRLAFFTVSARRDFNAHLFTFCAANVNETPRGESTRASAGKKFNN